MLGVAKRKEPEAFNAFFDWLKSPLAVVLHLVTLAMVMYHSITWFNLTPKVMVIWRGEEKVSPLWIAGANYVAWIIVTIVILWITCPK